VKWKKAKKHLFRFALQKNKAKNVDLISLCRKTIKLEAKREMFGTKTKRKNAVFILLRLEAKNLKRKEVKKKILRERAKRIWFYFVSFLKVLSSEN
jgi:hypothetical protein